MTKYLLAIIAALMLTLGAGGFLLQRQIKVAAALTAERDVLRQAAARAVARSKADRAVLVARQASVASEGRKSAQAQESLSKAVQGEKPWAEAVVPDSVQRAILEGSDASDSVVN